MGKMRAKNKLAIVVALASVCLAGCEHFNNLDSVPYDLGATTRTTVRNQQLVTANLATFTNVVPAESPTFISRVGLPLGYFHLVNRGDRSILIKARAMPGTWADYTIGSGDSLTFKCEMCEAGWVQIAIPTEGHPTIVRTIRTQARYEIFWDDSIHQWDLRDLP